MISNPTSKGKTSEAVLLAALVKMGKHVRIRWDEEGDGLALDEDGRLVRINARRGAFGVAVCALRMAISMHGGRLGTVVCGAD